MGTKALNSFLLGADPEFILSLDKVSVPVSNLTEVATFLKGGRGPVGWDHGGRVYELRPEPARHAYTLVKRLKKLLEEAPMSGLKRYTWSVLDPGNQDVTGGHIHFEAETTSDEDGHYLRVKKWPGGVTSNKQLATALSMITYLLETLDILPIDASFKRRLLTPYGKWGDTRVKNGHFEYRAMTSWLHSPQAAFLALTAAKLTVCNPEAAMGLELGKGFDALRGFFRGFASEDVDAERIVDSVLPLGIRELRVNAGECFQERWRRLEF